MSVLIVTESYFGHTSAIAQAVAEGITEVRGDGQASIVGAGEVATTLPAGLTAVIVAAPTHDFSLPTPRTREQARAKGLPAAARSAPGRRGCAQDSAGSCLVEAGSSPRAPGPSLPSASPGLV